MSEFSRDHFSNQYGPGHYMTTLKRIPAPRRVLIDHRDCGGGGCSRCKERGTKLVIATRPTGPAMPADPDDFIGARELCPCYEGISIHVGVSQCTHADRSDDGESCCIERCPLIAKPTGSQP